MDPRSPFVTRLASALHAEFDLPLPRMEATVPDVITMLRGLAIPVADVEDSVERFAASQPTGLEISTDAEVPSIESFTLGLMDFLGARARGFKLNTFSAASPLNPRFASAVATVPVEVHTLKSGGRVHYAPYYLQSLISVLGSPSSPVRGQMLPGKYVFFVHYLGAASPLKDSAPHDPLKTPTIWLTV